MKTTRALSIILIICLLLTGCSKANDFREANWGNSQSKVNKSEDIDYEYADDDLIMYKTELDDEPIEVYYAFVDNKLTEAEIKFVIGDRLYKDLAENYDVLAEHFTGVYGEPKNPDKFVWLDESEDNKDEEYWRSIYFEKLKFVLEWETKTTYARLELSYSGARDVMTYMFYARDIKLNLEQIHLEQINYL